MARMILSVSFFVLFFHKEKFLQISQVVQISILKRLFLL
ncbi:hypothetical protein CHCC20348_2346 [Bacillus paralicheniformis]|nr:hypothetical protein CHCC20348_2346 [Bacillus paralicheniformis]